MLLVNKTFNLTVIVYSSRSAQQRHIGFDNYLSTQEIQIQLLIEPILLCKKLMYREEIFFAMKLHRFDQTRFFSIKMHTMDKQSANLTFSLILINNRINLPIPHFRKFVAGVILLIEANSQSGFQFLANSFEAKCPKGS